MVTHPPAPSTPSRRVRVLSLHADYACRHAGACCSSGWDVPVEPAVEDCLRTALADGSLQVPGMTSDPFSPVSGLPDGARVVLRHDEGGRCVFLETTGGNLCAVHRQLGPDRLTAACRDFPRLATLGPRRVSLTLSHYCPTAAGLLFREDTALAIREDAPAFPASWPYEGLDAREGIPPLLRPGVLMDWKSHERWETWAVGVLAREGSSPEEGVAVLAHAAEEARRWTPDAGAFPVFFAGVLAAPRRVHPVRPPFADCLRAWRDAAAAVPSPHQAAPLPAGLEEADARGVRPSWPGLARPVRHYLAARAFASWCALQGRGLRTTVHGVRAALLVLRVEAARVCAGAPGALGVEGLREAIRATDLLLVHLAAPEALARRWSVVEDGVAPPVP